MGDALDNVERHQEALEAYDKAISLDPDHSNTWYNKATLLEELGRHQEASEAYDKVKSLDSD
jgi:tetratricopeptide (TPR) repeat protein